MEFRVDGRLRVTCGTAEIGTGAYTMFAQVASEATGVPLDRIDVVLGDTSLPKGIGGRRLDADGVAHPGCDRGCAGRATKAGGRRGDDTGAGQGRQGFGPFVTAGSVHHKDQPPASGTAFDKVIAAAKTSSVSGQGRSKGTISDMIGVTKPSVSSHSYAAHFVEVTWEPEISRLSLSRIVTTVDGAASSTS